MAATAPAFRFANIYMTITDEMLAHGREMAQVYSDARAEWVAAEPGSPEALDRHDVMQRALITAWRGGIRII